MDMSGDAPYAAAEQRARRLIDRQLGDAGWVVQDRKDLNLFAGRGIAVREIPMAPGHGRFDYLLYIDKSVVGVIEAKPAGTTLSGVEWHSATYADEPLANGRSVRTREGGFPVLRLTAISGDGVDLSQRKGSRGNGSLRLVARGALVRDEPHVVAYPDTLIRIRTDPSMVDPEYLSAVWNSLGAPRR